MAKAVAKPIKSIIKASSRPRSPVKSRQPRTSTTDRARIVLERSQRSGMSNVSGRSGLSNQNYSVSRGSSQASIDYVN